MLVQVPFLSYACIVKNICLPAFRTRFFAVVKKLFKHARLRASNLELSDAMFVFI